MAGSTNGFRLLDLPAEIRELIYHMVLSPIENKRDLGDGYKSYRYDLNILRVNRQLYFEARKVFRHDNIFVSIETPWPQAQQPVALEGYVPIVICEGRAENFTHTHLAVTIDAPGFEVSAQEPRKFVILVDDLATFCEMWYYSDLGHPGLNNHLRLTLQLRNPNALEFEDKPIPKALQQQLLKPFGMVKGLHEVRVRGEHYESIAKQMREEMDVPYESPEKCLEKGTRLKDAGNAELQKKNYVEAIRLYEEAFRAIHIICIGRRRSIWGDAFFHEELKSGEFKGQFGQIVRLVLRVRLVANIVLAYLKMEDYTEAHFWGMRSISIMRQSVESDQPMLDFAAANEMGKIYYRTGMASKALGNRQEALELIRVASLYLPRDTVVQKDLAALAPRLG